MPPWAQRKKSGKNVHACLDLELLPLFIHLLPRSRLRNVLSKLASSRVVLQIPYITLSFFSHIVLIVNNHGSEEMGQNDPERLQQRQHRKTQHSQATSKHQSSNCKQREKLSYHGPSGLGLPETAGFRGVSCAVANWATK